MYIYKLPNAAASVISVTSTATSVLDLIETAASTDPDLPSTLNAIDITPEDGDIRMMWDGNSPTSSDGFILKSGQTYQFRNIPALKKMELIRTGASNVSVSVQVGAAADSETSSVAGSSLASTSASGIVELATASETTAGNDTGRAITPDGLAGSDYGIRIIEILVEASDTDLATGDGLNGNFIRIPAELDGYNLVDVGAAVATAGTTDTTDIQIRNATDSVDMLSTKITIDSGETDSSTAATPPSINSSNDDVSTGDQIVVDVDAVSTTAPKGLVVTLSFQLP